MQDKENTDKIWDIAQKYNKDKKEECESFEQLNMLGHHYWNEEGKTCIGWKIEHLKH